MSKKKIGSIFTCILILTLLSQHSFSEPRKIKVASWTIEVECKGSSVCYASNNASYTYSKDDAKLFDTKQDAQRFLNSLTQSIQRKNPKIVEVSLVFCEGDNKSFRKCE